jgi:acetolactate synthase-1/2/3 large subunit
MVKSVFGVSELAQLDETICMAFETARSGEPGPVVVQLGAPADRPESIPDTAPANAAAARAVWGRIHQARKPVLFLGQGCTGSAAVIRAYVERTATPVFTTASGRGVIPEHSPWCLGYDSLRGSTQELNALLRETDLVIAVGARLAFNGTAGFGITLPPEQLVHIDASAANLNAVYPASNVVALQVAAFFALAESTTSPRTAWTQDSLAPWRLRIRTVQAADPEPTIAGQSPEQFFGRLRAALPDDALVVTDSGLHQVMARRYFEVREVHGLLLPTDLQSMGFALPSAIAAKLAVPSRQVVALVGDGGALMSGLELAIAVRERLPLTVIVFNDGYLNQIRMQQLVDSGREHGVTLPAISFKGLADATGADYIAGSSPIEECIDKAARGTGVTLIDVPVTDGVSVLSAAARGRGKAALKSALGARLDTLRRWLRG